jgi:hypothetical protein
MKKLNLKKKTYSYKLINSVSRRYTGEKNPLVFLFLLIIVNDWIN